MTPQRRAVVALLVAAKTHPTAEEIYDRVSALLPDVSRTTVYNTLHELVKPKVLTAVAEPNASSQRYDTNAEEHQHLSCLGCGALIDVQRELHDLDLSREETQGYRIVRHQVTFYGYCPKCKGKDADHSSDKGRTTADPRGSSEWRPPRIVARHPQR